MAGRVLVVGAGVVGLTCAVRLLEAGHRVDVVARDLPRETSSAVGAAFWYPYRALPQDRVTAWAATSYAVFDAIADTDPESGVRMVPGTQVFAGAAPEPWWAGAVPRLERTRDVPAGWGEGLRFTTPVADTSRYLDWLAGRVEAAGGTITRLNLGGLPTEGLVLNCSGLGARLLGSDRTVVPVRGQVVHVEQFGLDRWWLDEAGPTYVVPRAHDVVVGSSDVEGEWSRTPDPVATEDILERAARLVPAVRGARVLRHKVGLRPVRPAVRLERAGDVVHCYGHGGAGVTLSWGVADEVVALVERRPASARPSG
ncbi:FAD-dependent oxidoreductase [Nocardioides sp. URHA0032]|uniref:FAD-dependent oxidoreductase n=1 Tax=Nocardioides sp. URHA0032 TaxID=1380388 RepID=UPI000490AE82|nr:FAD-dependent oxidoreductase [Nocardioides sp. URHA0032]